MNEELRNEIVRRWQAKSSLRRIEVELHVSRRTIRRVLAKWEAERTAAGPSGLPAPPRRRKSLLDGYEDTIRELLERYPTIRGTRIHEELQRRGFQGRYTIVRDRVRQLRPQPVRNPVVRFETLAGQQAQMDYAVYDIDFSDEGRRRVSLFSYVLSYSRRFYLHFGPSQDFETTVREHIRAFKYFQGVAASCLYDNQKVVVLHYEGGEPIFNPRFLAFATHYGFQPRLCMPKRPQTKGKIERPFFYVRTSLLNGRTFRSLDHLNEVTLWWLAHVADVRIHRETKQRPLDRYAEEQPHLLALPAQDYDVAPVVYRIVNVEGFISYRQNYYRVPWRCIGQALPVRLTEDELIVYSPDVKELVRHRLVPRSVIGQRCEHAEHRPSDDPQQRLAMLRERFAELGPVAQRFLDGLLRRQRFGKHQAQRVLALLGTYTRQDLLAALERAVHFGAYALSAVERILAAQAKPRPILEILADKERQHLQPLLTDDPVPLRPTAEYQSLLPPETAADGQGTLPPNAEPGGPA